MRAGSEYPLWSILRLIPMWLAIALLPVFLANAQEPHTSKVVRDPQAIAILQTAVKALGGFTALSQVTDTTMQGTAQPSDSSTSTESFVWQSKGQDIRREHHDGDGIHIFTTHQGKGKRFLPNSTTQEINTRTSLTLFPFEMPGVVLLHILGNPDYSLNIATDPEQASSLLHIRALRLDLKPGYSQVSTQDWYFDSTTGLPVRVEFAMPDTREPSRDGVATITYDAWHTDSGLLFPQHMRYLADGALQSVLTISSFQINQGLGAALFQVR